MQIPIFHNDRMRDILAESRRLLNHDFCPWANRYVYWLKQPIGWFLVAAAASLLVGIFLAEQGLILFGAIVVVIILGVSWPRLCMHAGRASLAFSRHRCRVGESVTLILSVRNRWPLPLWGLAVEGGLGVSGNEPHDELPVVALARVPGWSETSFHFAYVPVRRGVYPQGSVRLSCGFPFGIWYSSREIIVQGELIAWPRTVPLESVPMRSGRLPVVAGSRVDRSGDEGDVIGVRPYRQGDSLRNIHWAQTARRDSFVVCERQQSAHQVVQVTVDVDQLAASASSGELMESAIRVGASIAQEFHAHHSQVICNLGATSMRLKPGPAGLKKMLDSFARYLPDNRSASPSFSASAAGQARLSIVVTVPAGIDRWQAVQNHPVGEVALVVLSEEDDGSPIATCTGGHARRPDVWMRINCHQIEKQLRQQWGRVCHDTSQR